MLLLLLRRRLLATMLRNRTQAGHRIRVGSQKTVLPRMRRYCAKLTVLQALLTEFNDCLLVGHAPHQRSGIDGQQSLLSIVLASQRSYVDDLHQVMDPRLRVFRLDANDQSIAERHLSVLIRELERGHPVRILLQLLSERGRHKRLVDQLGRNKLQNYSS